MINMKIVDVKISEPLYLTLSPMADARMYISGPRPWSFAQVLTDEGITGICPISPSQEMIGLLKGVLKDTIIGEDPFDVEKIWEKMYWRTYSSGRRGLTLMAISAVDIALWDIIGKACNKPIHKLLGGYRNRVPVYASGINLNFTVDELVKQNIGFVKQGFKAVKMKIGKRDPKEDLRRIKAVRDAIGYDIALMVDVNGAWSVNTAITMAKKLERYEIYWLEEPVQVDNIDGLAKVAASTEIPIAGSELENTKFGFRELIEREAIDIVQADATICGGITEFKKIAAIAEAYGLPMCPHGADQIHTPLVASIPNGLFVEYMPDLASRISELLVDPIIPQDGEMECSDRPGVGLKISKEAAKKYRVKPKEAGVFGINPRYRWPPFS